MKGNKDIALFIVICILLDAVFIVGFMLVPKAIVVVGIALGVAVSAFILRCLSPHLARRAMRLHRRFRRILRQRRFARREARS
ncbi:MAG: hypothetical protein AAB554_04030 [Patescibacteria group bacterium]